MGTRQRIKNEVTDRARVQVRFCFHFSFSRSPLPVPHFSNMIPLLYVLYRTSHFAISRRSLAMAVVTLGI